MVLRHCIACLTFDFLAEISDKQLYVAILKTKIKYNLKILI